MGRKREEQKYEVRSKGVHRKREMADSLETLRKWRHMQKGTKEVKI